MNVKLAARRRGRRPARPVGLQPPALLSGPMVDESETEPEPETTVPEPKLTSTAPGADAAAAAAAAAALVPSPGAALARASTLPARRPQEQQAGGGRARTHTVTPLEKREGENPTVPGPVPLTRQRTFEHLQATHSAASVADRRLALRRALAVLGKQCDAAEMKRAVDFLKSSVVSKWSATSQLTVARSSSAYKYNLGRFAASRSVMLALGLALPVVGTTHFELLEQPEDDWRAGAIEELNAARVWAAPRPRTAGQSSAELPADDGAALRRASTAPPRHYGGAAQPSTSPRAAGLVRVRTVATVATATAADSSGAPGGSAERAGLLGDDSGGAEDAASVSPAELAPPGPELEPEPETSEPEEQIAEFSRGDRVLGLYPNGQKYAATILQAVAPGVLAVEGEGEDSSESESSAAAALAAAISAAAGLAEHIQSNRLATGVGYTQYVLEWDDGDETNRVQPAQHIFPMPPSAPSAAAGRTEEGAGVLSADDISIEIPTAEGGGGSPVNGLPDRNSSPTANVTSVGLARAGSSGGLARAGSMGDTLSRMMSSMTTAAQRVAPPVGEEFTCSICFCVVSPRQPTTWSASCSLG